MNTTRRSFFTVLFSLVTGLVLSLPVSATPISGELFYTTFSGGVNVHKVNYSYDGVSTFTLSGNTGIASVFGADGISGNPNDANSLFIGGQGPRIHRVSKTGTLIQTLATPNDIFHLEVSDSSTLYGAGIPSFGSFTRATINLDGSLSAATAMSIVGGTGSLTQIITTPSGDFYTSSGAGGNGTFGTVSIVGTIATLTPINGIYPAAHGGVYDPFTDNIILFGDGHITQIDLFGTIMSDIGGFGGSLDQGTVDGLGHVFAANNNGDLTFIDYSVSGLIASGFSSTQFLAASLDDIAPLVGAGSTDGTVPEPATIVLMGLGLLGLGFSRHKARNSMIA